MILRIWAILLFVFASVVPVMAQTGLAGVWQGVLETGAGQKINLQLVINKLAGGAYGVTVHYVDRGTVKDLSATSVSCKDGKLAFNVDSLGGSYFGTLSNKTIAGEWRQGWKAVPMVLTPYKRPELNNRDMERFLGQWIGDLTYPNGLDLTFVCRFEKTEDGKLVLFMSTPDMGGNEVLISDLLVEGNRLNFKMPGVQLEYAGELTPEGIVGKMRAPDNNETDFNLVRGEYRTAVIRLDITAEEMKKLSGRWVGSLGTISVIFRFEKDSQGNSVIFLDIPERGMTGGRIVKASITNDTLHLAMPGTEYTGKITLIQSTAP
jgi:hypothetical protein